MVIIHHDDQDGWCAAAIIKLIYPAARTIGANYDDDEFVDKLSDEEIIMVDYGLQPFNRMKKLALRNKSFTWIDHHISHIEEAKKTEFCKLQNVECILTDKKCGCYITWAYFRRDLTIPKVVKLIDDFDRGILRFSESLPLCLMLDCIDKARKVNLDFWRRLFFDEIYLTQLVDAGKYAVFTLTKMLEKYIGKYAYTTKCFGIENVLVLNYIVKGLFLKPFLETYPLVVTWNITKNRKVIVNLYSNVVDVSKIAKKNGGGGHKMAAGFSCSFSELTKHGII